MNLAELTIRPIEPGDDQALALLIRSCLEELNVPKEGSTYADKELDCMYESFSTGGAVYFVAEKNGTLIGGAGIVHLKGEASDICELQKMYISAEGRGQGLGSLLLSKCLESAEKLGYRRCYLETMSFMVRAQELYLKNGFEYLDHRMGATGHYVCPVWMIKDLG